MTAPTILTEEELIERAKAVVSLLGDDVLVVDAGRHEQDDPDVDVVDPEPGGGVWVKAFIWVSVGVDEQVGESVG